MGLVFVDIQYIHASNPYILECVQCPDGCPNTEIDMCFSDCGSCDCNVDAKGSFGCPIQ